MVRVRVRVRVTYTVRGDLLRGVKHIEPAHLEVEGHLVKARVRVRVRVRVRARVSLLPLGQRREQRGVLSLR